MRTPLLPLLLALACLAPWPLRAVPPGPRGVNVLIIRHAEKSNGIGLSEAGQKRAEAYIHYFQTLKEGETSLKPDAFFAAKDSDGSVRPRLTLEPISRAFQNPINSTYKTKNAAQLADLLKSGRLAGRTVLVCWHHGDIPDLLSALGVEPRTLLPEGEWPDSIYNWLIVVSLTPDGALRSSRILNENLMSKDLREPPVAP